MQNDGKRAWGSFACLIGIAVLLAPGRCWSQGYTITTVAGGSGNSGLGEGGPATKAYMLANGLAVDAAGALYIADGGNNLVRKVTPDGIISTIAGDKTNYTAGYSGDGGPAASALLNHPRGMALDSAGNLYFVDGFRIRNVSTTGIITTFAGGGTNPGNDGFGDGGPATQAGIGTPSSVAVDAAGNVYIASTDAPVRKVVPDGTITIAAGCISCVLSLGDGGPATGASLLSPYGVSVDSKGNLYIADTLHFRIRKVSPDGTITTVAGSGAGSYQGDGGPAVNAGLYIPKSAVADAAGNIYIADTGDNRIRMVAPDGTIRTIAGTGAQGFAGDGGPATSAVLTSPDHLALGQGGKIYFVDGNSAVRVLSPPSAGSPPSVSSGGVVSASAFGQFPSIAPASWIEIYGANLATSSRGWSGDDFDGINAPTALDGTRVTIGGQPAFIDYISPGQVNVQVPSSVGTGAQPLIVTTAAGSSSPYSITVNAEQPGLLAPSSFQIGGRQYVAALFPDASTYVLVPGAIAGITSRRARPGDAITLYGVGFGPVTPNVPAGQKVQQTNALASAFHIFFGQTEATVSYAGLAPGAVGLYQFNVAVPNVSSGDWVPLTFTVAGISGTQTLYIPIQ